MYPEFASFWRFLFCFLSSEILRGMIHLPTYLYHLLGVFSNRTCDVPRRLCLVLFFRGGRHTKTRQLWGVGCCTSSASTGFGIHPPTSPCLLSLVKETARERLRSGLLSRGLGFYVFTTVVRDVPFLLLSM